MSDQLMSGERQPPLAVLLVDEESARRESLTRSFRELGFAVRPAAGLKEAIAGIRAGPPGLAVVQIGPVTAANLHLIIELRGRWLDVRIIVIDSQGFLLTQRAVTSGVSLLCTNEEDLLHVLSLRRVYLAPSVPHPASHPLDLTLARAEWGHIHRVLDGCGGNVTETARLLGIHRRSLQRKLRKHPPNGG
jgi:two-component system response regulator RegA